MATWSTLVNYVQSTYRIAERSDGMIKIVFDTGELRSQVVYLWRQTLAGDEEWVQIESPFAELNTVDLRKAVKEIGDMVCGGLAAVGEFVTVRHAVPLVNLNINEFERPLILVTTTADRLEKEFVGTDRF